MLNNIKEEIKDIINDLENLRFDVDYYSDEEITEDIDFRGFYKKFSSIISNLENIIKED